MAATPPSPSFSISSNSSLPTASKSRKPLYSLFLPKPVNALNLNNHFRCRIKCFESHHCRTLEHVSDMTKDSIVQSNSSASSLVSVSAANSASEFPTKNAKKVFLFYCAETKALAEKIAAESAAIELRDICWRTFPDGVPNIFIPNAKGIRGQHVAFLASFSSPAERFYFGDNILPCFERGIPLLKRRLQEPPDSDNIAFAFPDDGAWKRFYKQLQHFPTIVCAKVREGDQRIVRIKEGDPRGQHVVIVDDLVQSGGTLIECPKVLAAHGAAKISAYVTPGIFPNKSWARFEHDNGGHPENAFTYFCITDSCPLTVKEVMNKPPFEVLSLAGSTAASLQI